MRAHARHGSLARVCVIPSADVGDRKGSHAYLDAFAAQMRKQAGLEEDVRIAPAKGLDKGVDFENADELARAIRSAFGELRAEGFTDDEIAIDITGGQKPTSVVGGIFGLAKDRRIQYVSMHTREVWEYDVELA
ncbi:MAG: hypothetical protein D6771_04095 [Zetaproteobacteria bacterium]|nr:MAG: hypothetical protein D6771_04095 [Zetaproteobacteria bacterium]